MLLLMAVYGFLNELKQRLIVPDSTITIEINNSGDGLRFTFYWLKNDEKINIQYILTYEEIRSIYDNRVGINCMIDEVNKELQKKFNQDLFKI